MKIFSSYLLRFFLFSFAALLLLEFFLQLSAGFQSGNGNFIHHLRQVKERIARADLDRTIFFVGDSTVFGIGSSEPNSYSLVAQLNNFLKLVNSDFHCVNLAYVGICTEELLELLTLLPPHAHIIYRGGFVDAWNKGGLFRFRIASYSFEFRSLKMIFMLFPGLLSDNFSASLRLNAVRQEMTTILQRQQNIYVLEYSNYIYDYGFLQPFIKTAALNFIPLRQLMADEFLNSDGYLGHKYRNSSGSHPNDVGYYAEALALFNYFCHNSLFGLSPDLQRQENNLDVFVDSLQNRIVELKRELSQLSAEQVLTFDHDSQRFRLMSSIWEIADILAGVTKESEGWQAEQLQIEKLAVLVFHDPMFIGRYLLGVQTEKTGRYTRITIDERKLELYYYVMYALFAQNSVHWHLLKGAHIDDLVKQFPATPLGYEQLSVYPLALCPRFLADTGFSAAELSTHQAWEVFFPHISYDLFADMSKEACHLRGI